MTYSCFRYGPANAVVSTGAALSTVQVVGRSRRAGHAVILVLLDSQSLPCRTRETLSRSPRSVRGNFAQP